MTYLEQTEKISAYIVENITKLKNLSSYAVFNAWASCQREKVDTQNMKHFLTFISDLISIYSSEANEIII